MDEYDLLKKELLNVHRDLDRIVSRIRSFGGATEPLFEDWNKVCRETARHISEDVVRVAVVGTVKSGKSTFINSLLKGDFLKRGAGVMTSIVTRIRFGRSLKASLYFKSWDEINEEIKRALVLFPSLGQQSICQAFDIRRSQDRAELEQGMAHLGAEQLITDDTLNVDSVVAASFLKGYDRVHGVVASDHKVQVYEGGDFDRHKEFTGDDGLSVYLRDIQLEIGDSFDGIEHMELADCQGSDSPNPLHLAMVQDYLLTAHLVIYAISSRTGLRQADLKFLSIIRKMGIMDNVVFVVNCDFNEHESLDDLRKLVGKIKEDLFLVKANPEVYSFSALYNLFRQLDGTLIQKDQARLHQWETDREMCEFSEHQSEKFESTLVGKIANERGCLLLRNHLERFAVLASSIRHWGGISCKFFREDSKHAAGILDKIALHQESMRPVRDMIRTNLDGTAEKMMKDIRENIDRLFEPGYGRIQKEIGEFIRNYNVSFEAGRDHLKAQGFSAALYLVYQEFRQALDTFMTQTVNPQVIGFVKSVEDRIRCTFETACRPYDAIINDALDQYNSAVEPLGIPVVSSVRGKVQPPDLADIKRAGKLTISPAVASISYRAKIKTEALVRLGVYRAFRLFKQLLKKNAPSELEDEFRALKKAVLHMKRDTRAAVISHFNDYKENIKFQYFAKLVEATAAAYYERLSERFQTYGTDLAGIGKLIDEKRVDRRQALETVEKIMAEVQCIQGGIDELRNQMTREEREEAL